MALQAFGARVLTLLPRVSEHPPTSNIKPKQHNIPVFDEIFLAF
jgi:hypothetical protein